MPGEMSVWSSISTTSIATSSHHADRRAASASWAASARSAARGISSSPRRRGRRTRVRRRPAPRPPPPPSAPRERRCGKRGSPARRRCLRRRLFRTAASVSFPSTPRVYGGPVPANHMTGDWTLAHSGSLRNRCSPGFRTGATTKRTPYWHEDRVSTSPHVAARVRPGIMGSRIWRTRLPARARSR
jgi:hypothetical protein